MADMDKVLGKGGKSAGFTVSGMTLGAAVVFGLRKLEWAFWPAEWDVQIIATITVVMTAAVHAAVNWWKHRKDE